VGVQEKVPEAQSEPEAEIHPLELTERQPFVEVAKPGT